MRVKQVLSAYLCFDPRFKRPPPPPPPPGAHPKETRGWRNPITPRDHVVPGFPQVFLLCFDPCVCRYVNFTLVFNPLFSFFPFRSLNSFSGIFSMVFFLLQLKSPSTELLGAFASQTKVTFAFSFPPSRKRCPSTDEIRVKSDASTLHSILKSIQSLYNEVSRCSDCIGLL